MGNGDPAPHPLRIGTLARIRRAPEVVNFDTRDMSTSVEEGPCRRNGQLVPIAPEPTPPETLLVPHCPRNAPL